MTEISKGLQQILHPELTNYSRSQCQNLPLRSNYLEYYEHAKKILLRMSPKEDTELRGGRYTPNTVNDSLSFSTSIVRISALGEFLIQLN